MTGWLVVSFGQPQVDSEFSWVLVRVSFLRVHINRKYFAHGLLSEKAKKINFCCKYISHKPLWNFILNWKSMLKQQISSEMQNWIQFIKMEIILENRSNYTFRPSSNICDIFFNDELLRFEDIKLWEKWRQKG